MKSSFRGATGVPSFKKIKSPKDLYLITEEERFGRGSRNDQKAQRVTMEQLIKSGI